MTEAELAELPSLPEGWGWVRLGFLVHDSQNGLSKRSGKKGTPTKVLRLADISEGEISELNPRRITITQDEFEKYILQKNDFVCIRVNGSSNLVGRLILVRDNGDWAFCDHFIRVRLLEKSHVPEYIRYLADTQLVRKFMRLNMVSSAGQNTVSQTTLLSMSIPLCEKSEQRAIVEEIEARLSVVDKLAETIDAALQQAAALRQSILKQAFAGKLVPQNPNDEPASELLERIKNLKSQAKSAQLRMNL